MSSHYWSLPDPPATPRAYRICPSHPPSPRTRGPWSLSDLTITSIISARLPHLYVVTTLALPLTAMSEDQRNGERERDGGRGRGGTSREKERGRKKLGRKGGVKGEEGQQLREGGIKGGWRRESDDRRWNRGSS